MTMIDQAVTMHCLVPSIICARQVREVRIRSSVWKCVECVWECVCDCLVVFGNVCASIWECVFGNVCECVCEYLGVFGNVCASIWEFVFGSVCEYVFGRVFV